MGNLTRTPKGSSHNTGKTGKSGSTDALHKGGKTKPTFDDKRNARLEKAPKPRRG